MLNEYIFDLYRERFNEKEKNDEYHAIHKILEEKVGPNGRQFLVRWDGKNSKGTPFQDSWVAEDWFKGETFWLYYFSCCFSL